MHAAPALGVLEARAPKCRAGWPAPEAAPGFKTWLQAIAAKVAEAGSEGGFLGFGGEKVSPAEQATLERITAALG